MLGVVVTLLSWVGRLGWPPFVGYVLLGIPFIQLLYGQFTRIIEARREAILVKRSQDENPARAHTAEPLGGYFLIGPYSEDHRSRFRRADQQHISTLRWIKRTHESILVVTGHSGTGKSSLLQAHVVPELRECEESCVVIFMRSYGNIQAELRKRLCEPGIVWSRPASDLNALELQSLIERACAYIRKEKSSARLIVIFDQFEELLLEDQTDSEDSTLVAARNLITSIRLQALSGFTLVLALRSEYKAFLERLGVPPLQQGVNWQEVPAFQHRDAHDFLTAPESGIKISSERLRHVLNEAAAVDGTRGLIRPIVLNMVGAVLTRIADSPEAERPTRTLLAEDLRRVVNAHSIRALARPILARMLTEADTKLPRALGQLAIETGINIETVHGCLLDLELSGFVRQISRSAELADRVWEISHDFVARLMGPILKTPFHNLAERIGSYAYPFSIIIWIALFTLTLLFAPQWNQIQTERKLADEFDFFVKRKDGICRVTQTESSFSRFREAIPLLNRLSGPLRVSFRGSGGLTNLDLLQGLTAVASLDLSRCPELGELKGINEVKDLHQLDLSGCAKLYDLSDLNNNSSLTNLLLVECFGLTNLNGLDGLPRLQNLVIASCHSLGTLDSIGNLYGLENLELTTCDLTPKSWT